MLGRGHVGVAGVGPLLGAAFEVGGLTDWNSVLAPPAGCKLRIYYVSVNPSVAMTCGLSLDGVNPITGGLYTSEFLFNLYPAGSIVAKDFGEFRYLEGAVDAPLNFYNDTLGPIWINVFFREIPA
jgi:hypothetical protein